MDPARPPIWLRRRLRGAALAAALAALAGCGGGLYIGFGGDGDERPDVSLASAATRAAPGDSVQLVAAASDDYRVIEVRLYEVADNGSRLLLAVDASAPYQWTVIMPPATSSRVRYQARAIDDAGQAADSNVVEILLR